MAHSVMTVKRPPLVLLALLGLFAQLGWSEDALGQTSASDRALSEMLFRQGREQMDQGQTEAACAKFDESYRLDPALGTLLNLAVCHEKLGRLASAWAEYNHAAATARRAGDEARLQYAQEASRRLDGKFATLLIRLTAPAGQSGNYEINLDGRVLRAAALDTPIPVDPGRHQLSVTADGFAPHRQTIEVSGEAKQLSVEVPALRPLPTPAESGAVSTRGSVAPTAQAPAADNQRGVSRQTWGIIVTSAGLAGLAVAGGFGIRALTKKGERDDLCDGGVCPTQAGIEAHQAANEAATIANIAAATGGALLAAGVVILLWDGGEESGTQQALLQSTKHGTTLCWQGTW